jgi:hypothetical protein
MKTNMNSYMAYLAVKLFKKELEENHDDPNYDYLARFDLILKTVKEVFQDGEKSLLG